jgi:hypothetical protein
MNGFGRMVKHRLIASKTPEPGGSGTITVP